MKKTIRNTVGVVRDCVRIFHLKTVLALVICILGFSQAQGAYNVYIGTNGLDPSNIANMPYPDPYSSVNWGVPIPGLWLDGSTPDKLNSIMNRISTLDYFPTITLHFKAGTYRINKPLYFGASQCNVAIEGDNMSNTTLVMDPTFNDPLSPNEFIMLHNWQNTTFLIRNIAFDCNWANLPASKTTAPLQSGFKTAAIRVTSWQYVYIDHVKVVNVGANGCLDGSAPAGIEAFPITAKTFSLGTVYKDNGTVAFTQANPAITIQNCIVTDIHRVYGGYSTAIIVVTHNTPPSVFPSLPEVDINTPITIGTNTGWLPSGQRAMGVLTNTLALIQNNIVSNASISFGCAQSENVVCVSNNVINSGSAFNCDTLPNHNIKISNNNFQGVYRGINIGAPGYGLNSVYFSNIDISSNYFCFIGHLHDYEYDTNGNQLDRGYMYEYGIRTAGATGGVNVYDNEFIALDYDHFEPFTTSTFKTFIPMCWWRDSYVVLSCGHSKWVRNMPLETYSNNKVSIFDSGSNPISKAEYEAYYSDQAVPFPVSVEAKAQGVNFLPSYGQSTALEYIGTVQFGVLNGQINTFITGNNGGYAEPNTITNPYTVQSGVPFFISGIPQYVYVPMDEYWAIWIDWNQDGVFDVSQYSDERVASGFGYRNVPFTANNISVPSSATYGGSTRVRIQMKHASYGAITGPNEIIPGGEVEDYWIRFQNP